MGKEKFKYENSVLWIKKYEIILVWVGLTFVLFLFLNATGTLFSGFHLQDDREYLLLDESIKKVGFFKTLTSYMMDDLSIRFRPMWPFLKLIDTYFFMDHFGILSIKNAVVVSTSATCFYAYAKKMDLNCFFSMVFPAIILLGNQQTSVFWRLGTQEPVGILLFSFCMLSTWYLANKSTLPRKILFVILLALLSLIKESFLACVPGFFVLLFSLYVRNQKISNATFKETIRLFLKSYIIEMVILISMLLIESYILIFKTGLNRIGYAGFKASDGIFYYLEGIYLEITRVFFPYFVLLVVFILFVQMSWGVKIKLADAFEVCFAVYILLSQLVIHAKCGMYERYFLPATVGVAYMVIILGYRYINDKQRKLVYAEYLLMFLLYVSVPLPAKAKEFTMQADNFQELISDIVEHTSSDAKIILCSGNDFKEFDESCMNYLAHYYGYYDFSYLEDYTSDYSEIYSADVLFGVAGSTQGTIVDKAGLSKEDWRIHETDNYEIAIKITLQEVKND